MEEKFCPCCGNRCPADRLSCGRGRAYFGVSGGGQGERSREERGGRGHGFAESDDEVINLLRKCGHTLHHSQGEAKLDCLTEAERAQLIYLLTKCLSNL